MAGAQAMNALIDSKVPPAGPTLSAPSHTVKAANSLRPSTRRCTTPARVSPWPKFPPRSTSVRSSTITTPGARTSSPFSVSAAGLSNCTACLRAMSRIRVSERFRCAASSDLSDGSSVWGLAGCVATGASPRGAVPGPLAHAAPTPTVMAATIATDATRRRRTARWPAAT